MKFGDEEIALAAFLDKQLSSGPCRGRRFALVVWCDCEDEPQFVTSNDADAARVMNMIRQSINNILNAETSGETAH
jgi:hypothetical protein